MQRDFWDAPGKTKPIFEVVVEMHPRRLLPHRRAKKSHKLIGIGED
jgi:hypothetical protein